jgi:hypothetical protein
MNQLPRKHPSRDAPEIAGLQSGFSKIRILTYAEKRPVDALLIREELLQRGFDIQLPALNRKLLGMVRKRLLERHSNRRGSHRSCRTYSLTARGQKALSLVRNLLEPLVRSWLGAQTSNSVSSKADYDDTYPLAPYRGSGRRRSSGRGHQLRQLQDFRSVSALERHAKPAKAG